jgi:hypothetical protein
MKPSLLRQPLPPSAARLIVARGARADATGLRVQRARYDADSGKVVIDLKGGYTFAVPRSALLGTLGEAAPSELRRLRIEGGGSVLYWPRLDEGFDVAELLGRLLGPRGAAGALGRRGGASRSPVKAAAARANGRRGGRPVSRRASSR